MKNITLTLILLFSASSLFAQDCSTFYPFTEGAKTTVTSYDKRERVTNSQEITIVNVQNSGGNLIATANAKLKDKDGELITDTSFDVKCVGDAIEIDIQSMMSPELFSQFEGMETDITGTNIVMPNNMQVGDNLPDAEMSMSVNMSGININMNVDIKNRKVIAKENVTTPAGTFDCFLIEYDTVMRMGMARTIKSKQWIAAGVGLVKQEDYNNGGRMMNRNVLTAFTR